MVILNNSNPFATPPAAPAVGVQVAASILSQSASNPFSGQAQSQAPKSQFQSYAQSVPKVTPVGNTSPPQSYNQFGPNYNPSPQAAFQNAANNKAATDAIVNTAASERYLNTVRRADDSSTILGYGLSHPIDSVRNVAAAAAAPILGVSLDKIREKERLDRINYVRDMQNLGVVKGLAKQTAEGALQWGTLTFPYAKVAAAVTPAKWAASAGARQMGKNIVTGVGAGLAAGGAIGMGWNAAKAQKTETAQSVYDFVDSAGVSLIGAAIYKVGVGLKVNVPKPLPKAEFIRVAGQSEPGVKATMRNPGSETPQTITGPSGQKKIGYDYTMTRKDYPVQTAMTRKEIQNLYMKGETIRETENVIVKRLGETQGVFAKKPTGLPQTTSEVVNIVGKGKSYVGNFQGFDTGVMQYSGIPVEPVPSKGGFKITISKPAPGFKGTPLAKSFTMQNQALRPVSVNGVQPGQTSIPSPSFSGLQSIAKNIFKPVGVTKQASTQVQPWPVDNPFAKQQTILNPFSKNKPKVPDQQSIQLPQSINIPKRGTTLPVPIQVPTQIPRQVTEQITETPPPEAPTSMSVPPLPPIIGAIPPWLPGGGSMSEGQKYGKGKGKLRYKDELRYARSVMRGLLGA